MKTTNTNLEEQWAISSDGENYSSISFPTKEEAIREGKALNGNDVFYVGQIVAPTAPEHYFHSEDWLEHVSVQEDYCGEHAEDWDMSTKEQRDELDEEVSKVMAAWLDRHDLRPKFWNIGESEEISA